MKYGHFDDKSREYVITNPDGVSHGIRDILLNGEKLEGNLLPIKEVGSINEVKVIMG